MERLELIENENGYKKYSHFEISDVLETVVADDYYYYNSDKFNRNDLIEDLYKSNFVDKYDKDAHKQIFDLYINNHKFKEKAQFIYSIIDLNRYKDFIEKNPEFENPHEARIKYSIIDSQGVKVLIYDISLIDISFVF